MKTPAGHFLGRKEPTADPRDRHYGETVQSFMPRVFAPSVDLRAKTPPAFDQGDMNSCGPNSGAALMATLFPTAGAFSRLQIYANVRTIEDDFLDDNGVETRNVLKALTKTGAGPERLWPYTAKNLFKRPPSTIVPLHRLQSYSRLTAREDYLSCLNDGFSFILGFICYESLDSDDLARTGIMPLPNVKKEKNVGGHDVLVVGYDLSFKQSQVFKKSGMDPALVFDEVLLIRNSWGTDWGIKGHFYMPMSYALNPTTGGDAWTGRP